VHAEIAAMSVLIIKHASSSRPDRRISSKLFGAFAAACIVFAIAVGFTRYHPNRAVTVDRMGNLRAAAALLFKEVSPRPLSATPAGKSSRQRDAADQPRIRYARDSFPPYHHEVPNV
jgi:hypothetical protein